ncbi:putative Cytochrome oxidase biogenesis protein Sco1/SenC/PrrC, copper metallochaperone [Candidatus Nitrotoga sp. BS]|uniref:SCO family protein n=1 Tax=Candidatus Nitrotoga sp. BS TaxID=2890408 RepID=UPI001EF1B9B0|nr:SCO family protein [Candidatus Nitrotoga sp. BS]CAH1197979.1 putative Cytochrome oxidase biogenesis protein Sco1/SenC/PrrC, copper metallochaperone [Candidatus Nitrotoga sp. BS]
MRTLLLLLITTLLVSCEKSQPLTPFQAIDVSWRYAEKPVDFQLTDPNGKIRRLSDFKDKVVVMFFGYTHCPEICPTTLADLAQVMRLLDKDAEKVQVLFVTLDPERDTPKLLAEYVPFFHPSFLGLYGDTQTTAQVAKTFGVNYEKRVEKGSYALDHSDGTYLIGTNGKHVLLSPYNQSAKLVVQDIKLLLQMEH